MQSHKKLGLFALTMINVAAIDSIRNLPIIAEYGVSLIFFLLVGAFVFLLPAALISAELASAWPEKGGVYIWVKKAFGKEIGFLAAWLQWSHNIPWYPAVLTFIAVTFFYAFMPDFADNNLYLAFVVLTTLWLLMYLNTKGIQTSALISEICVIAGTILPSILLISLGAAYYINGDAVHINFQTDAYLPDFDLENIVFFSGIILGFCGIEMSASHITNVENPPKTYPKAILLSSLIIITITSLGALSIAAVVPNHQLDIVSGIVQAFENFMRPFALEWLVPFIAIFIIIGSVGMLSTWIIGPVRILHVIAILHNLPAWFQKLNQKKIPINLLFFQTLIASLIAIPFIFMPSVASAFWILSVLAAQLYMVMYFILFSAAIKLRYSHKEVPRPYHIPFGNVGIWVMGLMGIACSVFVFFLGFVPPKYFDTGHYSFYFSFLFLGNFFLIAVPWVVKYSQEIKKKTKKRKPHFKL